MEKTEVGVIGAGPAGLMAAIFSAQAGARTTLIEANTNAGRKLLMTGGGRCNITHQAAPAELVRAFGAKGKFLSYCLYRFSPQDVQDFFVDLGLAMRIEEDGCVFPVTDRAGDVRDVLVARAKRLDVSFLYGRRISNITKEAGSFVLHSAGEQFGADRLIAATGGLSWPKTGCTGDGYRFARQFGHAVAEAKASLAPLVTHEKWPGQLAGTAVAEVMVSTRINNKKLTAAGALIFTDDGIGGPAAQDMSRHLTDYLPAAGTPIGITLDLAPHVQEARLEAQMTERTAVNPKKKVANVLGEFVPKRLAVVLCGQAGCDDESPAGQLRKDVRKKLVRMLKAVPLSIVRTRPIAEATVTRGGVSVTEVDAKTMESKVCPGLFFAGEVLDVDGPCGGYNLQACWSTAALAGSSAAIRR
ncbi:MAG: NAD(P)/FAD-dependent oxidoreductase [Planctomycetota bacterium]